MVGIPAIFGTKFDVFNSVQYALDKASDGDKQYLKPLIKRLESLRDCHWVLELKESARIRADEERAEKLLENNRLKEEAFNSYLAQLSETRGSVNLDFARKQFEAQYQEPFIEINFCEEDYERKNDITAAKYRLGVSDIELNKAILQLKEVL